MIEFVSISLSIPFNSKYALVINFLLEKPHSYWISTFLCISETTRLDLMHHIPNGCQSNPLNAKGKTIWSRTIETVEQTFWHFFLSNPGKIKMKLSRWAMKTNHNYLQQHNIYISAVGTVLNHLFLLFSSNFIIQTRWICEKGN